jgi:2-succinyl-5-enolpyruvyl-6-hydroxy-3-cyclohexene-1-carboxylate synthase
MSHHPKQHLSDLIKQLQRLGLKQAVICPGSRSAPITLALARQNQISCSTVIDERSAGYIALGKSLALGAPVALVCTSGTALQNFAPAVTEAFYQRIPLLVLSADRPSAWIDQLDGQTIRQHQVLAPHTVFSASIPERGDTDTNRWHTQRLINEAWYLAITRRGPVHLNIPLHEPLYESLPAASDDLIAFNWQKNTVAPFTLPDSLQKSWNEARSILLVPGQQPPNAGLKEVLTHLATDPRVVILSEPIANAPGYITQHEAIVSQHSPRFQPDLLISWGEQVVSKQLKLWLRKYPAKQHWHIDESGRYADAFQQLHQLIACDAGKVLSALADLSSSSGAYAETWQSANQQMTSALEAWLPKQAFGDLQAIALLANHLTPQCHLHLGNSTPIRYWQMLPQTPALACIHANRGTSGIDGVNSTALGYASCHPDAPVWLVTGELSFIYDLNAFSSAERPENLKVVVINNGGGDIFRLIDGPATQPERETWFATPRKIQIEGFCMGYELAYKRATDAISLQLALKNMADTPGCIVLEVVTKPSVNQSVYQSYQQLIKSIA